MLWSSSLMRFRSGIAPAGASQHAAVEDTSAEVAQRMFELNVLGPLALTRAALPFLLSRRHTRIVVVSSMAAVVPAPGPPRLIGLPCPGLCSQCTMTACMNMGTQQLPED